MPLQFTQVNFDEGLRLTHFCARLVPMDKGATYRIVVRGELDERFAYLFNGMELKRVDGTTVLTGNVIDQAQLHGFIERLEELAVERESVERIGRSS